MVDLVIARPGAATIPWFFEGKTMASMLPSKTMASSDSSNRGLVSHHSSSPFNLTHCALDEILAQAPYTFSTSALLQELESKNNTTSSSLSSQGSRSIRVSKAPQQLRNKKGKARQRTSPIMAHTSSSSTRNANFVENTLLASKHTTSVENITALPQPARSGPEMYSTIFDNNNLNLPSVEMDQKPLRSIEEFNTSGPSSLPEPHTVPVLDTMNWANQSSSFMSKPGDTPSLVSSFAMTEASDDMTLYDSLQYHPTSVQSSMENMMPQHTHPHPHPQNVSLPSASNPSWSSCHQWHPDHAELCRQHFLQEDTSWALPGSNIYNEWTSSELISAGLISEPVSQTQSFIYPLSTASQSHPNSIQPVQKVESTALIHDQKLPMPIQSPSAQVQVPTQTQTQTQTHTQLEGIPKSYHWVPNKYHRIQPSSVSPGQGQGKGKLEEHPVHIEHKKAPSWASETSTSSTSTPSSQGHSSSHSQSNSNSQSQSQGISSPASSILRANMNIHLDSRNEFLITCKRRGLSYKDIKRLGGFKEAESTLRGRFRTLTKSKEQRVRKPKWSALDIQLLCEAVPLFAEKSSTFGQYLASTTGKGIGTAPSTTAMQMQMQAQLCHGQPPKVSWKKVAQYIWSHGGSYQFGNATCKKKWCEIHDVKM